MIEAGGGTKRLYIGAIRGAKRVLECLGMLRQLEGAPAGSWRHWTRSLFAVYDFEEMLRLDAPWWTYGAAREVEAFLSVKPKSRVFEFGSGASTVWLARRAGSVVSVEHDRAWHDISAAALSECTNVSLHFIEPDSVADSDPAFESGRLGYTQKCFRRYASTICGYPYDFDLIVIDGRARVGCLKMALQKLSADGLIVFDNSRRRRYQTALDAPGVKVTRLWGRAPALPYPEETALIRHA